MSTESLVGESIGFIEKAGEALGEAKVLGDIVVAEATKIASLAPSVTAEIQQLGLLSAEQGQSFTAKLATHEGAIQIVRKLASLLSTERRNMAKQAAASPGQALTGSGSGGSSDGIASPGCFVGSRIGAGQRDNAKIASEVALGLRPSDQ